MNLRPLFAVLAAAVALAGAPAFAQEQKSNDGQDLIERVVVRNRLYNMGGKLEVSPSVGLTLVTRLTDHTNFNVGVAYNLSDTLALELRGGYAYSRQTGLARQIGEHLIQRATTEIAQTDDLSGLWQMQANGALGARWAPIYGKISLMAELPVHFQFYLWGGAGAGTFTRQSLVFCKGVEGARTNGVCADWQKDDKASWLGQAAVGFRFFTHQGGGLRLEVRDYVFPDSYRENINRAVAEQGSGSCGAACTDATNPGLTNLVQFDLGYSFIF
jgi:outer membrane beta-barrel protein